MHATPDTKQTGPSDVNPGPGLSPQESELVARADERLAHAYEQIARADEQIARVNQQIAKLDQDAARHRGHVQSRGRPALRGFIGLLLAACISVAAFAWQSDGTAARLMSRWAPQAVSASSMPWEKTQLSAQPSPPAVQVAAADAALPQPAPPAQTAPQDAAPTAAPIPSELTQLLQAMARDLANVQQGIEELKASQEHMTRENAKIAEQIKANAEQVKANQEQLTRVIANASEQSPRPKPSAVPSRPVTTSPQKPAATLPSTQIRAQRQTPVQLQPAER
jgi:hypothetical protein